MGRKESIPHRAEKAASLGQEAPLRKRGRTPAAEGEKRNLEEGFRDSGKHGCQGEGGSTGFVICSVH